MALDTRAKRMAVQEWGIGSLPVPDGTLDSGDREQILGLPRFSDGGAPPPPTDFLPSNMHIGVRIGIGL